MRLRFLLGLALVSFSGLLQAEKNPELTTVPFVDLNRYAGLWHEIARLPDSFETNCVETTAEYTLQKDGSFHVRNYCLKSNGLHKEAKAVAEINEVSSNSKLRISFAPKWLQWTGIGIADYWIIDLDPNYQFAVVSEPGKQHLWILSRTPKLKKEIYDSIISKLKDLHFDLSHLLVASNLQN